MIFAAIQMSVGVSVDWTVRYSLVWRIENLG